MTDFAAMNTARDRAARRERRGRAALIVAVAIAGAGAGLLLGHAGTKLLATSAHLAAMEEIR